MRLRLTFWQFTRLSLRSTARPLTIAFGLALATMLVCCTPSCRAQEVNPDHFTATGVEDVYPVKRPSPAHRSTKQTTAIPKTHAHSALTLSGRASAPKQKAIPPTRKEHVSERGSGPVVRAQIPSSLRAEDRSSHTFRSQLLDNGLESSLPNLWQR